MFVQPTYPQPITIVVIEPFSIPGHYLGKRTLVSDIDGWIDRKIDIDIDRQIDRTIDVEIDREIDTVIGQLSYKA